MSYNLDYGNIKSSLSIYSSQLKELEKSREILIKESREVVSLCSKAIILIHSNKISDAASLLQNSFSIITHLRTYVISDLDRYLWPAEQEYVEAIILKEIAEKKSSLSGYTELNVSLNAYVGGLLDSIGEMKRMIYDRLRKNDLQFSLSLFEIMQSVYDLLYPFSVYDNIINGVRKKLDISKRIIEDTRITMTEAYQRNEFLSEFTRISNPEP
jgi:translin